MTRPTAANETAPGALSKFPRIVHQTWKEARIPEAVARCVESVREANREWDCRLHVDSRAAALVAATGLLDRAEFFAIPSAIERADVLRCAALYLFGGAYCDLDVECIQGFDAVIQRAEAEGLADAGHELLLTTDHPLHCKHLYDGVTMYMNHILIAVPKARFLETYLLWIRERVRSGWWGGSDPVSTTGPGLFTRLIREAGGPAALGVAVLPSDWFHPFPDMARNFPETGHYEEMILNATWRSRTKPMAVHYWWHSYCNSNCTFERFGDRLFETSPRDGGS